MATVIKDEDKKKRRVLVVDDHPIVRQGLSQLINQQTDLVVCGEAEDAPMALEAINTLGPDVALIDISLADSNGLELIKDIKARHSRLPILAVSMHDESLYAERTLRAGALGYIMKQEATDKVLGAIRTVLNRKIYVSDSMATKMLEKFVNGQIEATSSSIERLSDRELEVFQLIGRGYATRQVAEKLNLSVKTIETYREHIKDKMNLKNAAELVKHACQWVQSKQMS